MMKRAFIIFFTILFGSIILLYFLLSFYNVPSAEDLELSAIPAITGLREFSVFFYKFIQGRYLTAVLHYYHPLSYHRFDMMWTAPVLAIVSLLLSIYWFLRVAFGRFLNRGFVFMVTASLLAYLYAESPSVSNLSFLTNAIFVYTFPAAVMIFTWTCMIKAYHISENSCRTWWLLLIAVLLFLLGGGGEVFFPVMLFTSLLGAYVFRKQPLGAFALLFSTISGMVIAYFSMGNLLDLESVDGYDFSLPFLLGFSMKFLNEYMSILLSFSDLKLLGMTIFLVTSSAIFWNYTIALPRQHYKACMYSLLIALIIPAPVYILYSFIVYDVALVQRVVNCCLILFIVWWSVFALIAGAYLRKFLSEKLAVKPLPAMTFLIGIATYMVLLWSGNIQQAFTDWRGGVAKRHYGEYLERMAHIQNIPREVRCDTAITVYPYSVWPESIHRYVDLYGDNASPSWNRAYEAYFGVERIRTLDGKDDNLPTYRYKQSKEKK